MRPTRLRISLAATLLSLIFAVNAAGANQDKDVLDQGSYAALTGDPYWLQIDNPDSIKFQDMDAPRAIAQCRKELAEDPDNITLRFYLGRALLKNDEYVESLSLLTEAAAAGIASADLSLGINKHSGDLPSESADEIDAHYERARDAGHHLADHWFVRRKLKTKRENEITDSEREAIRASAESGYHYSWYLLYRARRPGLPLEEMIAYLENGNEHGDINATHRLASINFLRVTGGRYDSPTKPGLEDRLALALRWLVTAQPKKALRTIELYEAVRAKTESDTRRARATERIVFLHHTLLLAGHEVPNHVVSLYCVDLSDELRTKFEAWKKVIPFPDCGTKI